MTLHDYVTAHLTKPFAWGSNDCITFTVGWLTRVTETDWLALIPRWDSCDSANAAIESVGGLEVAFDRALRRIKPTMARDGDVALVNRTAYLFYGAQLVGPGDNGLVFINRKHAKCAWSF